MLFAFSPLFAILFEAPLAAGLTLAGAASLPIIIHLLNRKRFRIVSWAAMRFLLAAQKKNTRRLRLEQLLLLAIRTLIVILLVLAMASVMPWSEEMWFRLFPGSAAQAVTSSRRLHKILVLDGSFSMATRVGDTSYFDRAKQMAERIVQESPGSGFSVVLMASPPRRIVSEPSDDARRVSEEVQALRLPHGNADLTATLNAVENMLRQSPGKYEEREVYLLTDMQRSTWTRGPGGSPAEALSKIQEQARTIFVDVGQEGVNNVAITNLALAVPVVTTGISAPISVTLHNFSADVRKQARVEISVGRARTASADPAFALRSAGQTTADLAPGQNTLGFTHRFTAPGDYVLQARVDADALELDDVRSVMLTVKDSVPVMLVNGKPAAEVYDRATEWLLDALNPFQAVPAPRNVPARPKVLTESEFADAGLGDLTPYDCVFFCDVARLDAAEIRRVELHLRRGGGVVFCLGPRADLESYNRLLYRNGEGLLPARLLGIQEAPEKRVFNFFGEEKAFHEAPLEAFAGERDRISLLGTRFRQYVRAELPSRNRARKILSFMPEAATASSATPETANGKPLPIGDPALVEWQKFRGRVLLYPSTANMDWTSWPISPSYPAMMQELLQYAVAGRLREQSLITGEPLELYLQSGGAGLEVNVNLPDGRKEIGNTELRDEIGVLRWLDTEMSGLYRAKIGLFPQEYMFAVNVPTSTDAQLASESDPSRTAAAELQAAYPGWDFQLVTDLRDVNHSGGPVATTTAGRSLRGLGTVIARWLLLTMLVLLVVEVVLAWRFGHYSAVALTGEVTPARGRALPILIACVAGILFIALAGTLGHAAWTGDLLGFLPDGIRDGLERRLGVPAPAAGEGTRWHVEFMPYLWDAVADPWLAGTFSVLLAVAVVLIYFREGQTASRIYKLLLVGLRVFMILLTVAVLLPQLRLWFEREGWPDVAIIIDDSRSMSTMDKYEDEQVREEAERLGKETGLSTPERLQLAQALLTRNKMEWLSELLTRRRLKLHVYHCSSRAARIADVTELPHLEEAGEAIRNLRAEGESTQLGIAIRQVLNDFRGSSLTAVISLTDGITTEGEDLAKVSKYAAQTGVPLFFIGLGEAHEVRDMRLHDLQVEDSVFVNDQLVFEARLTAQGYSDGRSVPVTLYEKDKNGALKRLKSERVTTDLQGKPVKFKVTYKPTEPGERVFVLDVPEQPDEVKPADNNRLERTVFVRETKLIKILYIEGYARYEYRFVKHLMERESDRDPRNKSMDLKVLLLDADPEYAGEDRSAIAEFPTREELNAFDVILLGDVDPKDKKLGEKNLRYLTEFVKEKGGGLLMIAGPRYSPHAFKDTPLQNILPIQIQGTAPAETKYVAGYRPVLTATGRFHPIFRFSPDEEKNTAIWKHLAEMYWWADGYRTQPAAETLLALPRKDAGESDRGTLEKQHPLLVQQFVGAGRCMFFGFDETWRWRLRENEIHFNQFWIQTVRYLARSRQGRVELRLDRQSTYRRGEPIRVSVRFPDDAPPPAPDAKVEVVVTRIPFKRGLGDGESTSIEKETMRLTKVEGSRATYEGVLTRTPEAEYQFWLSSPILPDPKPRAQARVLAPPGEMEQLRMNQPDMERAAEESRGKFYTLSAAGRLPDDLPSGARIAVHSPQPPLLLWNHVSMSVLALGLLGTEWVLRKRKHLL